WQALQKTVSRMREAKKTLTYRARSSASRLKAPKRTTVEVHQKRIASREQRRKLTSSFNEIREIIWKHAEAMQTEFGQHPASWYFEAIMQRGRVDRTRRKANRWNAYLSQEVTKRNESVNGELPKNGVTVNISEIRATWNAMTKEEQFAATDKAMEELEEKRAVKVLAERKLAHSSFQDARHTAETIQEDLEALSSRTGVESLLILVRSNAESYSQPLAFASSPAIIKYFTMIWKITPLDIAYKIEAYLLSGINGAVSSHADSILELKKATVQLISDALYEAIDNPKIAPPRMNYANFTEAITAKYGLVLTGWPLPDKFCSPGDLSSRNELSILQHAWLTKQARFRKMSEEEFEAWKTQRMERITHEIQNACMASDTSSQPPTSRMTSPSPLNTASSTLGSIHSASNGPASTNATSTTPLPPPGLSCGPGSPHPPPTSSQFTFQVVDFSSVTTTTGEALPITKKPRKQRSDKNVKRGPRTRAPPEYRVRFAP
ncbi:hypothetical protein EYR36_006598, partial [Pleurotus pulmonarius]